MPTPQKLDYSTSQKQKTMTFTNQRDEYDMEFPLSWDPRYNVGTIQLFQDEKVTKNHEVKTQICFRVHFSNVKDTDLYSARLSQSRDGIILTEPILPSHMRDTSKLVTWHRLAAVMKAEAPNENLLRDILAQAQEINSLAHPVKRTFFRFPDGITCNNCDFNDDDNGNPPSDGLALIKWPFMLLDGDMDLPGFPRRLVEEDGTQTRVPYDNFVPGFFWNMALDADCEKVKQTAQDHSGSKNASKLIAT